MTDGPPGGSGGGLRGALAQLGASLLGLARTRLELVTLEFDEERERTAQRLMLLLVAVLFFAFTVLAISVLVVAMVWETHRFAALVVIVAINLVVALVAAWRLRQLQRSAAPPFSATLGEIERDRAWLAERFGREP